MPTRRLVPGAATLAYGIWLFAVSLLGMGCTFDPALTVDEVQPTDEAMVVIEDLAGRWQMHSVLTGQCPEDMGRPPFDGRTTWSTDGQTLTIAEWGCEVRNDVTLVLDELSGQYARGFYSSVFTVRGGAGCEALAAQYGLPAHCEVTSEWQAVRLGP